MPTHILGRIYDLIDVGRAERHHVRADRHSGSMVSIPQCSCKQAVQHVPRDDTAAARPRLQTPSITEVILNSGTPRQAGQNLLDERI